jgi:hypothetical protein
MSRARGDPGGPIIILLFVSTAIKPRRYNPKHNSLA